jgi:hypothetical protein
MREVPRPWPPLRTGVLFCCFCFCLVLTMNAHARPWLILPTENDTLFRSRPAEFYMFVDRNFEGQTTRPWEGGQYGFVRSPRREGGRIVFTRFHEGIDIRPLRRDPAGVPLDPVRAAAAGRVVHVSSEAGASNYGRYVVLEHRQNGSPYYTLYAHLGTISAQVGQTLAQGEPLGIMGYTGQGLNRERAHLHFEVCLLVNPNFPAWFTQYFPGMPDHHGAFNGLNLLGLDPAGLLEAVRQQPDLSVADFLNTTARPLFRVVINDSPHFALPQLYPWMLGATPPPRRPPAWAVTFSDNFIPLRIEPRSQRVSEPRVEWLGSGEVALAHQSRGLVTGSPTQPRLTDSGQRFAHLLTFPDR